MEPWLPDNAVHDVICCLISKIDRITSPRGLTLGRDPLTVGRGRSLSFFTSCNASNWFHLPHAHGRGRGHTLHLRLCDLRNDVSQALLQPDRRYPAQAI